MIQEVKAKTVSITDSFDQNRIRMLSEEFFEFKPEFSMAQNPLKEDTETLEIIPKSEAAGDNLFLTMTRYIVEKNTKENRTNGNRIPLPEFIEGHIILSKKLVNSLDISHPILNDISNIGHNYNQAMHLKRRQELNR